MWGGGGVAGCWERQSFHKTPPSSFKTGWKTQGHFVSVLLLVFPSASFFLTLTNFDSKMVANGSQKWSFLIFFRQETEGFFSSLYNKV